MKIDVNPKGHSDLACPYCRDSVSVGQTCSDCGARYHAECAQTFAVCAILGCRGRFVPPGGLVVLPRVGLLARRLSAWRVEGLGPQGPHAVILEPSFGARDQPEAARAVADLLGEGYTAYDGRLRLQAGYPEPLVRCDTPEQAAGAARDLVARGARARTISLADLVRPLETYEPAAMEILPDQIVMRTRQGGETRTLDREEGRLVVCGRVAEEVARVESRTVTKRRGKSSYQTTRRSLFPKRTTRPEQAALVFRPGERVPTFLRCNAVRVEANADLRTKLQGWVLVLKALGDTPRAEVRELKGETAAPLMGLTGVSGTSSTRNNVASILLLARLCHNAWEKGKEAKA
jgi:hypothetical protein